LGTGLGVGYFSLFPGTVGSLWGVPLVWGLQQLAWPILADLSFAVVFFLCGIPICTRVARSLGREDPGEIVFDEIAAFPFVFLLVPIGLATGVLGFLWFRLFDIIKPWPANRCERLSGGLGVMADDLIAGIYAAAMLMLSVKVLGLE
jgi:phosphatidylglycerophosphatase A